MVVYARVIVGSAITDLWFLGQPVSHSGEAIDARRFTACARFGPVDEPVRLAIRQSGRPARLTFGAFDMLVVDRALGVSFCAAAGGDVELVPAIAEDGSELSIANVLSCLDCIDESKSVRGPITKSSEWQVGRSRSSFRPGWRTLIPGGADHRDLLKL